MSTNVKTKMEEIKNKIQSDKNFANEFTTAPIDTVQNFFEVSADDAAIISECIKDDMKIVETSNSRFVSDEHVGYYYNSSGMSYIHIEKSGKVTFYHVTVSSYTDMCGITNDNLTISNGNFAVDIPEGSWYYISNGTKIDGGMNLPVQGTYSKPTITISGVAYTKGS